MSRKNSLHVRSPFSGNRTVTLCLVVFSPFLKGEMLSVFFHFVFFVSGSLPFVVFYRSSRLEKIFGSELLFFGCRGWSCVFR